MNDSYLDKQKFDEELKRALEVLRKGGIILYPTDTIWGLGCDAINPEAVDKIYRLKKRADSKSMIVLLDSEEKLLSYVENVPHEAWQLIEYSEKPLTIVYPGAKNLAKNIIAEDNSIGIRVTKDAFCKKLAERFRRPVVSTSANISGAVSPANFSFISEEIIRGVDYVVDLRKEETETATPSTIIKFEKTGEFKFLRK